MNTARKTYNSYEHETNYDKTLKFNLIIPKQFSDIKAVADYIPLGIPVLVNVSHLFQDKTVIFRILDYLNGYVDCCNGNLKRLSSELFLVSPYSLVYETDVVLDLYGDAEYDKDFEYSYL